MKGAVALAFAASSVFAHGHSASKPPVTSCGPADVQFSVKADYGQHTVGRPEPGKALVYVIERFQDLPGNAITPTVRVGLNGAWVGANRGPSYLVFSVDPGEHHLCASWQSPWKFISSQYSLTTFFAESGKVYFFEIEPRVEAVRSGGGAWRKDLAPVNSDEAEYWIAQSSLSVSHPKK